MLRLRFTGEHQEQDEGRDHAEQGEDRQTARDGDRDQDHSAHGAQHGSSRRTRWPAALAVSGPAGPAGLRRPREAEPRSLSAVSRGLLSMKGRSVTGGNAMHNQIRREAVDRQTGLTLRELEQLVDHAHAVRLPQDAVVTGRVADRGQMYRLEVTEPRHRS